jgi:hypothetical protein
LSRIFGDRWCCVTGDKFIASDNDTGEQLLPVTRTRTPWKWGAAKDRRKLKGINQQYLRLLKLDMATDGFIEPP